MPLESASRRHDDGGMALPDSWTRRHRTRTVLLAEPDDAQWALVPIRVRDRAAAHLRSLQLDAELAAGEPVTTDRLRAVRAAMLVAPALRRQLARGWQGVLSHPNRGIIPVRRSDVLAAQDDIHELAAALRCAGPVAPRGVAIANLLLTDGTGPLYVSREGVNLRDEVRIAIHYLNPIQASRL
jgi:hypothetical protein